MISVEPKKQYLIDNVAWLDLDRGKIHPPHSPRLSSKGIIFVGWDHVYPCPTRYNKLSDVKRTSLSLLARRNSPTCSGYIGQDRLFLNLKQSDILMVLCYWHFSKIPFSTKFSSKMWGLWNIITRMLDYCSILYYYQYFMSHSKFNMKI